MQCRAPLRRVHNHGHARACRLYALALVRVPRARFSLAIHSTVSHGAVFRLSKCFSISFSFSCYPSNEIFFDKPCQFVVERSWPIIIGWTREGEISRKKAALIAISQRWNIFSIYVLPFYELSHLFFFSFFLSFFFVLWFFFFFFCFYIRKDRDRLRELWQFFEYISSVVYLDSCIICSSQSADPAFLTQFLNNYHKWNWGKQARFITLYVDVELL